MASSKGPAFSPNLEPSMGSTRRKIVSNPYDSDSDVSFVQQYGTKKCAIQTLTLLDKTNSVATDLQNFGKRIALQANHVIQTFVASDMEESDGSDSDDDSKRARRARKKAMNAILDQAGRCAASLRTVAHEVPEACMTANPCLGLIRDDEETSEDERSRSLIRTRVKKKKASEAKPHDGSLSDSISVTTDAYSESYNSIESDGSSHDSLSSESTADSSQKARRHCRRTSNGRKQKGNSTGSAGHKARFNKLRRRRKQFLRRRAMEHAAGTETEDDEDASFHFGGPKLGGLKTGFTLNTSMQKKTWNFPSQELRSFQPLLNITDEDQDEVPLTNTNNKDHDTAKAAIDSVPDLVNTSNDDSLLSCLSPTKDTANKATLNIKSGAPRRLSSLTDNTSSRKASYSPPKKLKWQSMEKVILHLSPSPDPGYVFLVNSHLGPTVAKPPCKSMDEMGLQLGDIIIRLNGEDISSMEAKVVSDMIHDMAGESARFTYLRKNMEL